uniref:JmjC domain-containing protein n=1 Tax=Elaeophora elaphi TaxID=1147741 RepID=A0A0R3RKT1_9BILA
MSPTHMPTLALLSDIKLLMESQAAVRSKIEYLEPFVMSGCICNWKAFEWTHQRLAEIVKPTERNGFLRIRLGPKEHVRGKIIFENESKMAYISSLEQFFKWFSGEGIMMADDQRTVDRSNYWGYFDYNYVFDIMDPKNIDDISWRHLGLDVDPVDSTIWIGTPGAHTPCHYDSYGYNVHAQLSGSKRWILFEPSENMKPVRIPYEESTVFSSLDVIGADSSLRGKKIRMVTLRKGDVIFIPPRWWHCVQCVGINDNESDLNNVSVSVNTWIPLVLYDRIPRLQEAAVSTMVAILIRSGLIGSKQICPSESMGCYDDSLCDFEKLLKEPENEETANDEGLDRLMDFIEKQKRRMTVLPIVLFADFRAEQEKGPLKIVDSSDESIYRANFTASSSNITSFQKHFINSLLSEKVLTALIAQLQEWI